MDATELKPGRQAPEADFDDEIATAPVKDEVDIDELLGDLEVTASNEPAVEEINVDFLLEPEPIKSSTAERIPAPCGIEELLADLEPADVSGEAAMDPIVMADEADLDGIDEADLERTVAEIAKAEAARIAKAEAARAAKPSPSPEPENKPVAAPEADELEIERKLEEAIDKREREEAEAASRAPTPASSEAAEDDFTIMPGFNPKLFYKSARDPKRERLPAVESWFARKAEERAKSKSAELRTKAASPTPRRAIANEAQARLKALREAITARHRCQHVAQHRRAGKAEHLILFWVLHRLAILDAKGEPVSAAKVAERVAETTGKPCSRDQVKRALAAITNLEAPGRVWASFTVAV